MIIENYEECDGMIDEELKATTEAWRMLHPMEFNQFDIGSQWGSNPYAYNPTTIADDWNEEDGYEEDEYWDEDEDEPAGWDDEEEAYEDDYDEEWEESYGYDDYED